MSIELEPETEVAPVTKFDPVRDLAARERLLEARVRMLMKYPFWGKLALRMRLINADNWVPTAATNGRDFFYNTDFILGLKNAEEAIFLFAHETLHCVYDHIPRTNGRHAALSNIAQDMVINADLIHGRVGEKISGSDLCYQPKYYGWNFEAVYDDLMKDAKFVKMSDEELNGMTLDDHINPGQPTSGDGQGDVFEDENGNLRSKSRPAPSEEEKEKAKQDMRDAMIESANSTSNAGDLPLGIGRIIRDIKSPVMDWRDLIDVAVPSLYKDDYSYTRLNKKYASQGFVFPGLSEAEKIDVAVAIDTSGSISDVQLQEMFSEVVGIMEMYADYIIRVWQFDTETYGYAEFTPENKEEITEYKIKGGGGTDFMANWKFMRKNEIEPELLIMFTDGYPYNSWGEEDYCDTIFIIHNSFDAGITAPFGRTAYYEKV